MRCILGSFLCQLLVLGFALSVAGADTAALPVAARETTISDVLALRPRAEQGDVPAQVSLGEVFHQRQQYSEAVYWYRRAATNGEVTAQLGLAGCLIAGTGVAENRREAAFWIRRAADGVERAGSQGTNVVRPPLGPVVQARPILNPPLGAIILTRSNAAPTTSTVSSEASPEKNLFTNADSRSTRATRDDNLSAAEPRLQERNVGLKPSNSPK